MLNITFIGRERELQQIATLAKRSFFLVVTGRRRIGKTTLLRQAFPQAPYLFIWPNKSLEWITARICEEYQLPAFQRFTDIVEYLLDQKKIVVIDEIQNFLSVDKSVYGELQKMLDERKYQKKFLKIAVAGSSYSLMKRVFHDVGAALYGRRTAEIHVSHILPQDLFHHLNIPLKEFIELWSVFEGVPYYYELLEGKSAREQIKHLVLSRDSLLQGEGKAVLAVEFGSEAKTYSTVLSAIAEGKTKLQEIATLFDNKPTEVMKYLDLLRNEFHLVQRETPVFSPPKAKQGSYQIIDNFLQFWFYFVDRQKSLLEQQRFAEVEAFFADNFNSFIGRKFEKFVREMVANGLINVGFPPKVVGREWGVIPSASAGVNQYEIDICAVDEKHVFFAECKWEENVNAASLVEELRQKVTSISPKLGDREVHFALFAKSFKSPYPQNVVLIDLKELEKHLRISGTIQKVSDFAKNTTTTAKR